MIRRFTVGLWDGDCTAAEEEADQEGSVVVVIVEFGVVLLVVGSLGVGSRGGIVIATAVVTVVGVGSFVVSCGGWIVVPSCGGGGGGGCDLTVELWMASDSVAVGVYVSCWIIVDAVALPFGSVAVMVVL